MSIYLYGTEIFIDVKENVLFIFLKCTSHFVITKDGSELSSILFTFS